MKHVYRNLAFALIGVALFFGATTNASAAWKDNSWELGIYIPYVSFDSNAGVDNTFGYGVRGGYNIKKGHEVELNYHIVGTEDDLGANVDVDFTRLTVGYLYNWTKNDKFTPFVTGGFGTAKAEIDAFSIGGVNVPAADNSDSSTTSAAASASISAKTSTCASMGSTRASSRTPIHSPTSSSASEWAGRLAGNST